MNPVQEVRIGDRRLVDSLLPYQVRLSYALTPEALAYISQHAALLPRQDLTTTATTPKHPQPTPNTTINSSHTTITMSWMGFKKFPAPVGMSIEPDAPELGRGRR